MALTQDINRSYEVGDYEEYPVLAAMVIYEGAAIGVDVATGYVRPLVSGDPFLGFAQRAVNNLAGASGDENVRVRTSGSSVSVVELDVVGATLITGNDNSLVFATDDNTFTLTPGGTTIGYTTRFVSGIKCMVFCTPGYSAT